MRYLKKHGKSGLNSGIVITADERVKNGVSHDYQIKLPISEGTPPKPMQCVRFQEGLPEEYGVNGISDEVLKLSSLTA